MTGETERNEILQVLGYRVELRESRSDGRYHETIAARARVIDSQGAVIHEVHKSSRSGHQLKRGHRHAVSQWDSAVADVQQWLVANREDARLAAAQAAERQAAEGRENRRQRWESLGSNDLAYALDRDDLLSVTELAVILGFRNARQANQKLMEWSFQTRDGDGYAPVNNEHGRLVGYYFQLRWTTAGLWAIWQRGEAAGLFTGGAAAFTARLRTHTRWFDFSDLHDE
jgi:hypothetical protein